MCVWGVEGWTGVADRGTDLPNRAIFEYSLVGRREGWDGVDIINRVILRKKGAHGRKVYRYTFEQLMDVHDIYANSGLGICT